jgi:hypothetical protein
MGMNDLSPPERRHIEIDAAIPITDRRRAVFVTQELTHVRKN